MVRGRRNVDLKETPAEGVVESRRGPSSLRRPGTRRTVPNRPLLSRGRRRPESCRIFAVVTGSDGSTGRPPDGCSKIRSEHSARHEPQVALYLHVGSRPGTSRGRPAHPRRLARRQGTVNYPSVPFPNAPSVSAGAGATTGSSGRRRFPSVAACGRPVTAADATLVNASPPGAERSSELPRAPRKR